MGTQAQRKKLFDGMSAKNAKVKLSEIWIKAHPGGITLNRASKRFGSEYNMNLLSLCETWHRLREQNHSVDCIIQAFAESVARKNKTNHALAETIHNQRAQLEKLNHEISRLKIELEFKKVYDGQTDGGQGPIPSGQSSET